MGRETVTLYSVSPLRPSGRAAPLVPSSEDPPRPVAKVLLTRVVVGQVVAVWAGDRADGGGLDLVGGKADACGDAWVHGASPCAP